MLLPQVHAYLCIALHSVTKWHRIHGLFMLMLNVLCYQIYINTLFLFYMNRNNYSNKIRDLLKVKLWRNRSWNRTKKIYSERERDKHMLTLALSGGSQVTLINPIYFFWVEVSRAWADDSNDVKYLLTLILTLINPIFSEWKFVGLELTNKMMYHTWV